MGSRRWKILNICFWLVSVSVILLFLAACGMRSTPATLAVSPTPKVDKIVSSCISDTVPPGEIFGLSLELTASEPVTISWEIDDEGGEIIDGQGTNAITYRAPTKPGTYSVKARVECTNSSLERTYLIEVRFPATDTPIPTAIPTPTRTPRPIDTPISTPTPTPTATPTQTATPSSTTTLTPTATPTPTPYPTPVLTGPENGSGVQGEFPPLYWEWDGELGEGEFFEVRIWHESITDYHPALGWVKVSQFDYNIKGTRHGKYYWAVALVKGTNARRKEWTLQPWWPYPMWEGDLVAELSPESEHGYFLFTPTEKYPDVPGPPGEPPPTPPEP